MNSQAATASGIEKHLLEGERVIWNASPVRKPFLKYVLSQDPFRLMGYYFFFFGLVFALFPLLIFSFEPARGKPSDEPPVLVFAAFGLLFAGIGYSQSFARSRRAKKLFANTRYFLTNRKALILSGAETPTVTYIDLPRVPQISLALVDGAIGNITFGESDPSIRKGFSRFFDMSSWWRPERSKLDGFIAIPNAEDTMRRIAEIKTEDSGAGRGRP